MFYSLLKQGFSPVSPSKRASRISRSEVPACYLFPFTPFRAKATLRPSEEVARPKRSGRSNREKDESMRTGAKKARANE